MPAIACLNGVYSAPEAACVPVEDRGYLFGDGVYETMRCYNGRIWALERHLVRLDRSLKEVNIRAVDLDALREWIQESHRRSELQESIVYLQVTRGVAPRQHVFTADLVPNVLITIRPTEAIPEEKRASGVSAITTEDQRWARRDIKSTNLLPNVLAKQAAHDAGAFEAILVEPGGRVTEGSSTNAFMVVNGTLWTAPADHHILGGITRDLVLGLARKQGLPIREQPFEIAQLRQADEIFLSGTTTEVLGITTLDGQKVGSGQVGPITHQLYQAFARCVREGCDALG